MCTYYTISSGNYGKPAGAATSIILDAILDGSGATFPAPPPEEAS